MRVRASNACDHRARASARGAFAARNGAPDFAAAFSTSRMSVSRPDCARWRRKAALSRASTRTSATATTSSAIARVSDQNTIQRQGVGGDQHVIGANRASDLFQMQTHIGVASFGRLTEAMADAPRAFQRLAQPRRIFTRGAETAFGGHKDAGADLLLADEVHLLRHATQRITHEIGHHVRVQHVAHQKLTGSGGGSRSQPLLVDGLRRQPAAATGSDWTGQAGDRRPRP